MKDIAIILKYRARELFSAAVKFNNIWLSLFLWIYISAFTSFLYNFPSMVFDAKTLAVRIRINSLDSTSYPSSLFFLLIFSLFLEILYLQFLSGSYREYIHLPIKRFTLNLVFFGEPVFLNIINYYIWSLLFKGICSVGIPIAPGLIIAIILLLLFKVLMFLLMTDILYLASKIFKKIEKYPLAYNSLTMFFMAATALAILITFIIPFLGNVPKDSILNYFYANLPTTFLAEALLAFSRNNLWMAFGDLSVIFIFMIVLYLIFRRFRSPFFYGEDVLLSNEDFSKALIAKSPKKIFSYKANSLYRALIKKEINYFITITNFSVIYAILGFLLIIMNSADDSIILVLVSNLFVSILTPFFLYSHEVNGLHFLKSLPILLRTVYRVKMLSCIFVNVFFMAITYSLFYALIYKEFNAFLFSRYFFLFTCSAVWFNIYTADLFLFFAFSKKSRTIFSKRTFFNVITMFLALFATIYFPALMLKYYCRQSMLFLMVLAAFSISHMLIHISAMRRIEN